MNLSNIVNSIKYTKTLNQLNDNASNLSAFEFGDESHIHSNTHASIFYALSQIIRNTSINSNLKLISNDHFSSMNGIILISYFDEDYTIVVNGTIKNI